MDNGKTLRIGNKLSKLIDNVRQKNKITHKQAGEEIADWLISENMKKQIRKKVIKDIEF